MKPMSDGAAFNRLLCLSQLCYIMASNTCSNTLHRKTLCGAEKGFKVKTGVLIVGLPKAGYLLLIVTDCQSLCGDLVTLSWLYQADAEAKSESSLLL